MVTKISNLGWIWDDEETPNDSRRYYAVEEEEPFWIGRVSWSPDGSDIMFTRPELYWVYKRPDEDSCRVCIAAVDGSYVRDMSALRLPSYYSRYWLQPHPESDTLRLPEVLAWSPDGSRIAVRSRHTWYGVSLYTIDRDGKDLRVLLSANWNREPPDKGSCSNGVVVPSPEDNPVLVEDCRILLGAAETLGGSVRLQWTTFIGRASKEEPIAKWGWVELDGKPPRVVTLDVHGCGIEGCIPVLYGQIPLELGDLGELRTLSLKSSELNGHIPPKLGNLTNLETLDLSYNLLTGSIPPELGNLTNLETLDFRENRLTGSIPPELGNLTNLETLDLSYNRLTGSIPPELGNLTNLETLNLSYNRLTGSIPPELGNLTNLETLNLGRGNELTGCIPSALRDVEKSNFGGLDLQYCKQTASSASSE